jgi:hypothetical protein
MIKPKLIRCGVCGKRITARHPVSGTPRKYCPSPCSAQAQRDRCKAQRAAWTPEEQQADREAARVRGAARRERRRVHA